VSQCEKTENQAETHKSHAVAGIEAHQHRHIVVSFVMTGEIWLMLICQRWVTGRELCPQNV